MGGLVFASLDQVPSELHDNAIILGCLSFFVGFLFIIDLADPLGSTISETTQTDLVMDGLGPPQNNYDEKTDVNTIALPIHKINREQFNSNTRNTDIIETSTLPRPQTPVFAKVFAGAEKVRPTRMEIPNSYINKAHITHSLHQENRGYQEDGHQTLNTYVRGSIIDNGNLLPKVPKKMTNDTTTPMTKMTSICCQSQQHQQHPRHQDGTNTFKRDGYVANAARMWERRSRNSSFGMQTNV